MLFSNQSIDKQAIKYFGIAYQSQMQGDYDQAEAYYKKSIDIQPTAEAYTFLGWTYSFKGNLEKAIEECHKAIKVDPDFGNPYNDIGSYLVKRGQYKQAVTWFEQAKLASRYENREFAYYNLGKVYEHLGRWPLSIEEYREALNIQNLYHPAKLALIKLEANYN